MNVQNTAFTEATRWYKLNSLGNVTYIYVSGEGRLLMAVFDYQENRRKTIRCVIIV